MLMHSQTLRVRRDFDRLFLHPHFRQQVIILTKRHTSASLAESHRATPAGGPNLFLGPYYHSPAKKEAPLPTTDDCI